MKTLVKWAIKRFANADRIKDVIHKANARLADREAGDRAKQIMAYGEDVSETVAAYLNAYADDGKMDADELAAVNAQDDKMVDKYLSDARIDAIVDALLG